jgi:hypothetical protein
MVSAVEVKTFTPRSTLYQHQLGDKCVRSPANHDAFALVVVDERGDSLRIAEDPFSSCVQLRMTAVGIQQLRH